MPITLTHESTKKAVGEAIGAFLKENLGWTPDDIRVVLTEDLTIVILRGTLSPAEQKMAATPEGRMCMKKIRNALLDQGRDGLMQAVATSTHTPVARTLTAIDVSAKEERFVFVFGANEVKPPTLKDT